MAFRSNFFTMMIKTYCFLQSRNFIRSIILGLYMLNNNNSPSGCPRLFFSFMDLSNFERPKSRPKRLRIFVVSRSIQIRRKACYINNCSSLSIISPNSLIRGSCERSKGVVSGGREHVQSDFALHLPPNFVKYPVQMKGTEPAF